MLKIGMICDVCLFSYCYYVCCACDVTIMQLGLCKLTLYRS